MIKSIMASGDFVWLLGTIDFSHFPFKNKGPSPYDPMLNFFFVNSFFMKLKFN